MTVKALKRKLLVILILFTLFFTNCGYTLQAIATSEEFKVISKGFFGKDEIKFNAYFVDEDGNKTSEIVKNVNEHPKLVLEITPQVEGVLKKGTLRLVPSSDEGKLNFKVTGTIEDKLEKFRSAIDFESLNDSSSSYVLEPVGEKVEETPAEAATEETKENLAEHFRSAIDFDKVTTEAEKTEVPETEEQVVEETEKKEEVPEEVNAEPVEPETEEKIVDEEALIEKKVEEEKLRAELENAISDISIVSDNEISLSYLKDETVVELELEYLQDEKMSVKDLMQEFKLQLSGSFINSDLNEVKIGKEEKLTIGWNYTKDFGFTSEYTKFSPFEIGDAKGTILENKITVSRNEDKKYLPVKSLNLEIEVPSLDGQKPKAVEVNATKLMATRGEDIGEVTFSRDNWIYDEESGKVVITVNNETDGYAKYSMGEDEFIIVYRYENYVEKEPELTKRAIARLEEYSSPNNNILEKQIDNRQAVLAEEGQIVTCSATTTEDRISKARIFANYNSDEALYETEFKTQVSVNILTSDILKSLKIDATKELYKDIEGTIFESKDVRVKQVRFNYSEVSALLQNGGDITIKSGNGEVLYILTYQAITGEDDVVINTNDAEGLIIVASDIANNGIINFEITKVIKKSTYSRSAFKSFVEVESKISAEVEYSEIEGTANLGEETITKKFEEAQTIANISLNKTYFSTLNSNEDVELKIELNNDKENSDLYKNPSFEIVFPSNITEVEVESINLLYEDGLSILDHKVTKEDEQVKIRVDLIGTQTRFIDSGFTNGTNIILNLKVDVDDYTPAKEDQIKMYYCNEDVTNYQTQTKWSISKSIPNGILKTTNGFDVAIINYQTPSGLVVASGIINYDGKLSEIKSVKQGSKDAQIPRGSAARIAKMELLALNNTGNDCTDLIFIGRIPFKGNKDVVTNEDLGTTILARIVDGIQEDINNKYLANVYYSTNPEATRSLKDEANDWKETPENLNDVRSFLIVVKGTMEAGTVLKYTYDFEIPESLPYETNITGSFGAYFNNHTENGIIDEASTSEKVSLITEAGPRIEAHLDVDVGDGVNVSIYNYLKYTLSVINTGSITAEQVTAKVDIPKEAINVKEDATKEGDVGYIMDYTTEALDFDVGTIEPGDTKEYTYILRVALGTEDKAVRSKAIVTSPTFSKNIESNEIINRVKETTFAMNVSTESIEGVDIGEKEKYTLELQNVLDEDLNNVIVTFNIGEIYKYDSASMDGNKVKTKVDEQEGKIHIYVGNLGALESKTIEVDVVGTSVESGNLKTECYFEASADGKETEKGRVLERFINKSILVAEETSAELPEEINENDVIILAFKIENKGTCSTNNSSIELTLPDKLEVLNVNYNDEYTLSATREEDKVICNLPIIGTNQPVEVKFNIKALNMEGFDNSRVEIDKVLHNDNQSDITFNPLNVTILNNRLTLQEETELEQKLTIEQNEKAFEEYVKANNVESDDKVQEMSEEDKNFIEKGKQSIENTEETNGSEKVEESMVGDYNISGKAWYDTDKNGSLDEEKGVSNVKVYLYNSSNEMLKSTVTNSEGNYSFNNIEEGKYYVGFNYDDETHKLSSYKKSGVEEGKTSEVIKVRANLVNAMSNNILVADNVENLNIGLQDKDTFDLKVSKYLSKVIVKTPKGTKEYNYDNKELAKVEIDPKYINDAKIDIEYTIIVENIGNIEGYAGKVADYIEPGIKFDEEENPDWYMGTDGYLYTKSIDDEILEPGKTKELKLIVHKDISEDNTGVLLNKVKLLDSFTYINVEEDENENTSVQNLFVSVSTGSSRWAIPTVIVIFILAGYVYMNYGDIIKNSKHIYKQDIKRKYSSKKIYK